MTEADRQKLTDQQCSCCGKRRDPDSVHIAGGSAWLCGIDYAVWLRSAERRRAERDGALSRNFMDFVARRRAEALNGTKLVVA